MESSGPKLTAKSPMEVHHATEQFLVNEAYLLDQWKIREWLELLTDDIEYRMPVRVTRERNQNDFSEEAFILLEDKESLKERVDQFETEFAWHENPPSRLRHFVSNIAIESVTDEEINCRSYVLLRHNEADQVNTSSLSAERHDSLEYVDGEFKLQEREVLLDHTSLGIDYISTFL